MTRLRIAFTILTLLAGACAPSDGPAPSAPTVHYYQFSLPGFYETFDPLIDAFRREHPEYRVRLHTLPTSTDDQHQFYLTHLKTTGEGRIDVLALDVIWMAEFARAGLLAPLTDLYPSAQWDAFFQSSVRAGTFGGEHYGVPLFVDAGVLYSRRDLLQKYGFDRPPETWDELKRMAKAVLQGEGQGDVYGLVWQGRQYEGLICNFIEFLPHHRPWLSEGGGMTLNRALIAPRLQFMKSLLDDGISPASVLAMAEEQSRHVFQNGRAVFMRNWPYAWRLLQQAGSPVAGKVWMSPVPAVEAGGPGRGALGGFLLGMHRDTPHPEAARAWIEFLTSPHAQKTVWRQLGLTPARRSVLQQAAGENGLPVEVLIDVMEHAVPRPVTPLYIPLSQSFQAYLSGVLAGVYTPDESLRRMDADLKRITRILEHEHGV